MKLFLLICAVLFVASGPSLAGEQDNRFVEFPNAGTTVTFDLNTVHMILPGKFTIISTTIDNPDVMKLKLKVLNTLRTYCGRPDGKYPAPEDVFTLGPPDMPVQSFEVESKQTNLAGSTYPSKMVSWSYPYLKLALKFQGHPEQQEVAFLMCRQGGKTEAELYSEHRTSIMNGIRFKELFDCKRGLTGSFLNEDDDPAKAISGFVRSGTYEAQYYLGVCYRVTHELPYDPK
jgi:hypothetical protein